MERLEVKAAFTVDEAGALEGVAWDFSSPDRVGDVIEPAAFADAVGKSIPALFAHDQAQVVGVFDSITVESDGLKVKGRLLVDTVERAREVRSMIQAKAVQGLSLGFLNKKSAPRKGGGRTIKRLELLETSIVAIPAHPGARITSSKDYSSMTTENAQTTENTENTENHEPEVKAADLKAVNDNLAAVTKRLDDAETKLARPNVQRGKDDEPAETKAFNSFIRRGNLTPEETKALTVATDTAGGYMVPDTFVAELLKNIVQFSPVRQYARVMNISSADVTMPKRTGTMSASWVGETADRSATQPTYGQVTLTPYEAACYVDVSNQLLEDSAINIAAEVSIDGAEEFGRLEGAAFVSGDGSGKPAGIMVDADIEEIETAGAAAITGDELIGALYDLPAFYRNTSTWGMNSSTLAVVRKLKDTNGQYLWQPSLQAGQPELLLGRPIAELPDMDNVGASNAPIVLGDFNQGYRIVDRVQMSILRDPYTLATKGQTRFHLRRRVGGGVVKAEALRKIVNAAS